MSSSAQHEGPSEESMELVPCEVSQTLLSQIMDMEFPRNRAIRALHFSGAETVEQAINWLIDNQDAEDIDEPLFVKPQKQLTPEEKRDKIELLRREAKERREKTEKEDAAVRERERIRMGKEMQASFMKEKEQERLKMIELRKKEKQEDQIAKEKIRVKLEEDRRARRKKAGLPEDLTKEEKRKEEEKQAAKAKEEKERLTKHLNFAKPVGVVSQLRDALVNMKRDSNVDLFKTACSVLVKYIGNIARNPNDAKYRRIKLTNPTFLEKVASVQGGVEFFELCGFTKSADGEFLTLPMETTKFEYIEMAGVILNDAINNPFFGVL